MAALAAPALGGNVNASLRESPESCLSLLALAPACHLQEAIPARLHVALYLCNSHRSRPRFFLTL